MAATVVSCVRRLRAALLSVHGCQGLRITGCHYSSSFSGIESTYDFDSEDEAAAPDIKSVLKRQRKAVLFHRMKRQMEPRESPERRLTWAAMEQIRYLKQEFPEEWTVSRLAEGFNVSTGVITRVLRSKFTPSDKRRDKQDAKVVKLLAQIPPGTTSDVLQPRFSSNDPAQPLLASGSNEKQFNRTHVPQLMYPSSSSSSSSLVLRTEDAVALGSKEIVAVKTLNTKYNTTAVSALSKMPLAQPDQRSSVEEDQILDEDWDGEVLSDNELEEISKNGLKNTIKVVQKGREFFDTDGNFLYRI